MYMLKFVKQNIVFGIFLSAILVVTFLFMPCTIVLAENVDLMESYEQFNSDLMTILNEYDDWQNVENITLQEEDYKIEDESLYVKTTVAQNYVLTDENSEDDYQKISSKNISYKTVEDGIVVEKTPEINRLIVNSDLKLDDCGAVAKAEFGEYHIFQYANAEDAASAYEYYSNLKGVSDVGYDYVVSADETIQTEATFNYNSWGAEYIGYQEYVNAMLANTQESDLPEIVVAVLDSGIYTDHELFEGRILFEYGRNFTTERSQTDYAFEDYNGHGTHVSGTIAEATLSNVKILPLKVLMKDGTGLVANIVNAINYAVTLQRTDRVPNLKVMNMSVGVDRSTSTQTSARSSSLTSAIEDAYAEGILSVVSAGNESQNTAYASPANVDCAIAVSGLRRSYNFFTGEVLTFDGSYSNYGEQVDFCAPGTLVESAGLTSPTDNDAIMNGTSMAAPHVTACVALVYSNPYYADYSPDQVFELLKENADKSCLSGGVYNEYPVPTGERNDYYGYGLICLKNLGLLNKGYVTFSQENQFPTESFELNLSYSEILDFGQYCEIYYSTDENVSAIDISMIQSESESISIYSSNQPIEISKTTKVTAVAIVRNFNGNIVQKSYSTSIVYYFDNFDLNTNFAFSTVENGVSITSYNGTLENLQIPEKINDANVVSIEENAFRNSNVKVLILPSTVSQIKANAFSNNTVLEEIYCTSMQISVGDNAFKNCSALSVVGLENIIEIGDQAFAYCTALQELRLPRIETIGQHAFSGSGIETLLLGKNLTTFKNQTELNLNKIYGFKSSVAETFAYENSVQFFDLTLRITSDLSEKRVVKAGETVNMSISYTGYLPTYKITCKSSDGSSKIVRATVDDTSEFEKVLNISISDLTVGEYELTVSLTDDFSTNVSSQTMQIEVVDQSTETVTLTFDEGQFDVYVDGNLVSSGVELIKNYDYTLSIVAKNGYQVGYLAINGHQYQGNLNSIALNLSENGNLEINASEKSVLNVIFQISGASGKVLVEGVETNSASVERNQNLQFEVETETGTYVRFVTVDGELLSQNQDGEFVLENVDTDKQVEIVLARKTYKINLVLGKGGNLSSQGGTIESVSYGDSRTFIITCEDGYEVEYVTINGQPVELSGNTLTLNNIEQDYDIVVSFREAKNSIFDDENSYILIYFIVIAAVFVAFVIAKIVLYFVRKNRKKKMEA